MVLKKYHPIFFKTNVPAYETCSEVLEECKLLYTPMILNVL